MTLIQLLTLRTHIEYYRFKHTLYAVGFQDMCISGCTQLPYTSSKISLIYLLNTAKVTNDSP